MSTLNYSNYENHRPHSLIYQNLQVVPEAIAERNNLVIIGSSDGQFNTDKYKGLVPITSIDDINLKIASNQDATTDNYLYWAAVYALAAGGGKAFYVLNVAADDANWTKALKALKTTDRSLFVVPLTFDSTIQKTVVDTCVELSSAENQKWKRVYAPVYPNGKDGEIDAATADVIASNLKAFTASVATSDSAKQRTMFIWTAGAKIFNSASVNDDKLDNLSNMYVAAIIGAMRAALLPQQGLSRKTVNTIAGIPNCYLLFDKADLNKIAVGTADSGTGVGICIIAQDDEDSEVYVRHQLTNDLSRGIMYYEDSVGVNVDVICYGIKDIVKPYIGQRNNNQDTLIEIRNRVTDYLLGLTNTGVSLEERRIGPQISRVDLESIIVMLDKDLKDRVIISFDIEIPLPLNTVVVHVNAFADLDAAASV